MRPSRSRLIRVALLGAVGSAALLVADVSPGFALSVVPMLLLAAALIAGAFPGERVIERLRGRRATPAARRARPADVRPRPAGYVRPVGRAAVFALAMRPPPGALADA
jgi:hypothetical protein